MKKWLNKETGSLPFPPWASNPAQEKATDLVD
jgi:hypothetical protein